MEEPLKHVVYSKNVIEFVTVAKEFCDFLESAEQYPRREFITITTRIIPLLYLKASMLPKLDAEMEDELEKTVDEMTYAHIQNKLELLMGRFNDYLEVFNQDMQRSDTPVISYIAEDLADMYQDLKDFISAYRIGVTEIMNDAVSVVQSNFELYWGQKAVNTLRALHALLYGEDELDEEEGEEEVKEEKRKESWFDRFQKEWSDDDEELS
nr:DUF5063 domain-containing protein [uncultured Carboxylicivirga sp.]